MQVKEGRHACNWVISYLDIFPPHFLLQFVGISFEYTSLLLKFLCGNTDRANTKGQKKTNKKVRLVSCYMDRQVTTMNKSNIKSVQYLLLVQSFRVWHNFAKRCRHFLASPTWLFLLSWWRKQVCQLQQDCHISDIAFVTNFHRFDQVLCLSPFVLCHQPLQWTSKNKET